MWSTVNFGNRQSQRENTVLSISRHCTHTSTKYIHTYIMAVDLRHLMESFIAEWLYAICKKNESSQIIEPSERITNSLIARHEKSLSSFKKRVWPNHGNDCLLAKIFKIEFD